MKIHHFSSSPVVFRLSLHSFDNNATLVHRNVENMKKTLIITTLTLLVCIILSQSNVLESLLFFLLVGAIPGTSLSLPPSIMLTLFFAIAWVVAFRLVIQKLLAIRNQRDTARTRTKHKKRLPVRRFKRIESTS